MGDTYENIESLVRDPTPCVLFLTEDKNKQSLINSFRQASVDKSGSNFARLQYVTLADIPDFTGLTIDYIGPKLINGDSFLTYPGSIVIYIDITSVEHYENYDYLPNIENNVSYFAKDLTPFINNQTKVILMLNFDTNSTNPNVNSAAIKNFSICTIEHILCFCNEDLDKNIKKAEDLCYTLNNTFCERHIRHLKKLKLSDSDFFKNNPGISTQECNKWESLRHSYIAYIHELLRDGKNSLKNYDIAWNLIKYNDGVGHIYTENYNDDDNFHKTDSIDIINTVNPSLFIISEEYYDILAIELIRLVILVKESRSNDNFGSLLRKIVQQYYQLVTNNKSVNIYTNTNYLYRFARLHYFISEKLSGLENVLELRLEFFKFKPYHMFTAGKYTYMLHKLIKSKNSDNDNSINISYEYGVNILKKAFSEFSNVGWNAHCYITLVLLFKFYMLGNYADSAESAFNKIYQNQLFNYYNRANYNQIGIHTKNICTDCMWKNEWHLNDDILSFGKRIISNEIGWICTALKSINGDPEAVKKVKDGVASAKILKFIPLQINIPGRATLYLSEEIILLAFKLNVACGFYCCSGQIKYHLEDGHNTCSFTFEPMATDTNNKQLHQLLVGLLEAKNNLDMEMKPMELNTSEYYLFLTPFDHLNATILSKSTQLAFNISTTDNDSNNLTLFNASVPLVVQEFTCHPVLIRSIGWPRKSLKYELPYSKRKNSVIRTSVKVKQLTSYWIDRFAPIMLEFDVYNFTVSHKDIKITMSNCDVTAVPLFSEDKPNGTSADINNNITNDMGDNSVKSSLIKHFKYQLNVIHHCNTDKIYNLQIQVSNFDILTTKIQLEYTNGIIFTYKKETIVSDAIGVGDFVNYSVKTTNLTKDTLNVVKLIYDDQKVIAPGELGIIDNLLSNESCVILLNDHISLDTVPQEIKILFHVNNFSVDGNTAPIEWIATAKLRDDSKYGGPQDLEVRCASDSIARIGTEFNYEAQIKNNTANTQELQLKLNCMDSGGMELLVSGPTVHNMILLPYDSKVICWKMVSTVLGHIKLPNVIIEKKRWIHTGDDQPMESALTHICILPNNA